MRNKLQNINPNFRSFADKPADYQISTSNEQQMRKYKRQLAFGQSVK